MKLIKVRCKDVDRNAALAMQIITRIQKQYRNTDFSRQADVLEEMLSVHGTNSSDILEKAKRLEVQAKNSKR